jgi:hypothetical protein
VEKNGAEDEVSILLLFNQADGMIRDMKQVLKIIFMAQLFYFFSDEAGCRCCHHYRKTNLSYGLTLRCFNVHTP